MDWDDLNHDKPNSYNSWFAYFDSKLANVLFTKELAKQLQGTNVTTYAVHPGYVRTNFECTITTPYVFLIFHLIVHFLYAKSPIQGAQTTIYCAVSEEVERVSGFYYRDCRKQLAFFKPGDAKRLWLLSAQMVGL